MKKKAKFIVELEYDSEHVNELDHPTMNVTKCEVEGDYLGLTLALTSGLAFATNKGKYKTFKDKLLLLRSTGSALISCISLLAKRGWYNDDIPDDLLDDIKDRIKQGVDLICYGIALELEMTDEQVIKANKDYSPNKTEDNGKRNEQRGTESDDFNDYL